MSRIGEIEDYLIDELEFSEDQISNAKIFPSFLALIISMYAHRDQKRINGEPYVTHPISCSERYQKLIRLLPEKIDPKCKDLLEEHSIPYDGVQEVCLLHDVLEDTDFTMDELRELFIEHGFKDIFINYIEEPLSLLTHDSSVPYEDYIDIVMTNPTASLVKLIDLTDNSNMLTLDKLTDHEFNRIQKYLNYAYKINNKYHFIENIKAYVDDLRNPE